MRSKADLHIHTTYSDGVATVPELLEHVAKNTDLKVIAITDHDCIDGALQASRMARHFDFEVIVGEEITTLDGDLLALFIDQPIAPHLSARETIKAIHDQGGLAIAPHPFDRTVSSLGQGSLPMTAYALDGIEGLNAGVYFFERSCNEMAQRVAEHLQLPVLGNSDSHCLSTVGRAYTRFEGNTAQDLYDSIKQKQVSFAGAYWGVMDYVATWTKSIHQKGISEFVRWALQNSGYAQQWQRGLRPDLRPELRPARIERT